MAGNNGAASVYGVGMRVGRLDASGVPLPGPNNLYVTDALVKFDKKQQMHNGNEVTQENAQGQLCYNFRQQDVVKRMDVTLQICSRDPELTEMLAGGRILTTGGQVPLAPPVITSTSTATTGGTLTSGVKSYRVSATTANGETLPSAEVSRSVPSGTTTNTVTVNWTAPTVPTGGPAITGYKVYGRLAGTEHLIGSVSAGTVTFTDDGSAGGMGDMPVFNTSALPGTTVGWQMPKVNTVANPNGVSLEIWSVAVVGNSKVGYWRNVFPRAYLRISDSSIDVSPEQVVFEGYLDENLNWGKGPMGDWAFDSTAMEQRAQEAALPVSFQIGYQPLPPGLS